MEPVGTVPPPHAQHAMLASTPFVANVSNVTPRLGVQPEPWQPFCVHQFKSEYKLQSSPSTSSQAWFANVPPKSLHCTVAISVVCVEVVGGSVGSVDVLAVAAVVVVVPIVVSSKLTGVTASPLTLTVTELLETAAFAVAANVGLLTTMVTTMLPHAALTLRMSSCFNDDPDTSPFTVFVSTVARVVLPQST